MHCQHCRLSLYSCICAKVESFFAEAWDVMSDDSWSVSKVKTQDELDLEQESNS